MRWGWIYIKIIRKLSTSFLLSERERLGKIQYYNELNQIYSQYKETIDFIVKVGNSFLREAFIRFSQKLSGQNICIHPISVHQTSSNKRGMRILMRTNCAGYWGFACGSVDLYVFFIFASIPNFGIFK